jgi:GT2 family glycosyltransferase
MSNDAYIFIVIPVHNRRALTRGCLESLRKQTVKNFKVIVVDDGSTDGTSDMIRGEFPEITLLHGDGHLWWTRATNLAVKYALEHGAKFIMTLNNDTRALEDYVEKMIFWVERRPRSLLGALALDATSGRAIFGGEIINWGTGGSKFLLDTLEPSEWKGLHEVTHFPGRGLLIPAEVFSQIGLFDEKHFPHYAADYDFTHRARKAGFRVFCNYDARILIYPDESGNAEIRKTMTIANYKKHLFDIKGGANLKVFTIYSLKNCPAWCLPWFLFRGYVQRLFGYWIDFLVEKMRGLTHKPDQTI